jgi:VCBS repeat-containing protein
MLACFLFQVWVLFNPPTATITIVSKSRQVTLSGTLHLGRLIAPITLSQSQTTQTTGKGYQTAKQAQGAITFFNGLFTSQTVAIGTVLTGSDGVQIATDQDAIIPTGNPPSYGQTTVSAHALNPGTSGNIPAYDINQACCANAVLAKNTTPFVGGQDERHFQTVAKSDVDNTAIPLKTALAQSVSGAFQGQLQPNEQLHLLPCTPQVTADHQPGEEATWVNVTVTEICSAIAYDQDALQTQATALLTTRAATKLSTGYSLIGNIQVTVKQANIPNIQTHRVILSFQAQGRWAYAVEKAEQQHIKHLIAGKTKQDALQLLASLPGIEKASIHWDGFGDDTRLPKDSQRIHLVLLVG